jgi:alpha-glucosidase
MMISHLLPDWLRSVHHDPSEKYLSEPSPALGAEIHIRLRVAPGAPLKRIFLRHFPDGEQALIPLHPGGTSSNAEWWECRLVMNQPVLHYRFTLEAADGIWFYSAAGPSLYDPLDSMDFRLLADYHSPAWLGGSVFYQIFPDRFANGDPHNDPQPGDYQMYGHGPQTFPWGGPPAAGKPFPLVFYGGDLPGILQRLDYLQSLGVTGLYLNPVFTSYSNHKYDVVDYDHVDPHLGGDQALVELRSGLTGRNMHYILDIVPNHCGYWHPWFQAARQAPTSVEAGFFTFERHPDQYASWLGVGSLPKLNYNSLELRRRIYQSEDAVFRRWLKPPFSADGWRIDVANMLARQGPTQMGTQIAGEIRRVVKDTRPDSYLVGENFFDATSQLQGDQWDGVMNYMGFTMPLWHWLRGYQQGAWGLHGLISNDQPWPSPAFEATIRARRAAIPWVIFLQQLNLLGSHDTQRIRSIVGGNRELHHLAAVLQFTYPGIPCIYYGDEIGLQDDPALAARGCMPWEEAAWDQASLEFYRRLIQLRRNSIALQRGGFQVLHAEEDVFAFQRETKNERYIVIAQRSPLGRPALPLPIWMAGITEDAVFDEFFSGQRSVARNGSLLLPELPQGGTIWREI